MLCKISRSLILSLLLVLGFTSAVYAYINFNTAGPDTWLDPGYQWDVAADAGSGNAVCIQWSTDGGSNWDRDECTWVGPAGDAWQCDIPNNYTSATVIYEFYKDVDADNCAITFNEWEWTGQFSFQTGTNAVDLSSVAGRTPLVVALVAGSVGLGGVLIWRRKRR